MKRLMSILAIATMLAAVPLSHIAIAATDDSLIADVALCAGGQELGDLISKYASGELASETNPDVFCNACALIETSTRPTCDNAAGYSAIESMFTELDSLCTGTSILDCDCEDYFSSDGCTLINP